MQRYYRVPMAAKLLGLNWWARIRWSSLNVIAWLAFDTLGRWFPRLVGGTQINAMIVADLSSKVCIASKPDQAEPCVIIAMAPGATVSTTYATTR
jgi:hypothetical protein